MMSPRPARLHTRASKSVLLQLDPQVPLEWELLAEFELHIDPTFPPTVRIPDLVVCRREGTGQFVRPGDVLIAIEIVSPGSRHIDHVTKRREYEGAGIPNYWIVDLGDEPRITALVLGSDGRYSGHTVTGVFTSDRPFAVELDLAALIA